MHKSQEPTREDSGPILMGVEEQVHKGTCSPYWAAPPHYKTYNCKVHNMRLRCINTLLDRVLCNSFFFWGAGGV
jgi:hypothetical protein